MPATRRAPSATIRFIGRTSAHPMAQASGPAMDNLIPADFVHPRNPAFTSAFTRTGASLICPSFERSR